MEVVALSVVGAIGQKLWSSLLNEDTGAIKFGGGHKLIMAKQELQELENYISYASFIVAGGVNDPRRFLDWISNAQLDAFCLEDQIAMYAMQGPDEYQLYAMKSAIGRLSIEELTKNIKDHIAKMPSDLKNPEIMAQLPEISPFIRYSHIVPADKIFGMDRKIEEINNFLRGDHQVLFVIGGQGSGKTTLMEKVYGNSNEFNPRSWVNVEETRGLAGILKKVLEGSTVDPDAIDEFEIMKTIHDTFKDKRYLIVLDNVQDTYVLYTLMHVLKDLNGKIICLTRRTDIHEDHLNIRIPNLGQRDARMLLMGAAFPDYSSTAPDDGFRNAILWRALSRPSWNLSLDELDTMVTTLNYILSKCQGNPWNIRTIGALLEVNPFKKWREIKDRIVASLIHDDGSMNNTNRDPPIKLEDANLSREVRLGFLCCLAFPDRSAIPETSVIPKRKLIRLWTAEGFLQDSPRQSQEQEAAEGLLDELVKRKLLVIKKKSVSGEVLKCSVNEHMRPLALKMCDYQKICRFVASDDDEASSPSRTENSATLPCLKILPGRKRALSTRYRMLAVHGHGGVKVASTALTKDIRLRSLLYFKTETIEQQKFELSFQGRYKLLRTLELQGANLDRRDLPSSIGCLVCLRYLGLRGTELEHLTPSLQRLKHLMCLDIRDTNIQSVDDVSAFTEMRHLLLAKSFQAKSVLIREGLQFLVYLQTLSGAQHRAASGRESFEEELLSLKLLRKLSIKKVAKASSKQTCEVISKMEFLRSLTITWDGEQFDVASLKIGKNLQKLKLCGDMGALSAHRLSMMQSITYLYLWDSTLPDDPLLSLQGLQHLLLLSLYNAYHGKKLSCENGYRKLKKLSIMSMKNLKECTFGQGSMRNLEELVFAMCEELTSLPVGLTDIRTLREVRLSQMLPEFCKKVKKSVSTAEVQEVKMQFHKSSRASLEGSKATASKPITPPAAEGEGTQTKVVNPVTPPRGAQYTKDTKSGDGAASAAGSSIPAPSKFMADAQKSYKHSKAPPSPTLASGKGKEKEIRTVQEEVEDYSDDENDSKIDTSGRTKAGAGYEAGQTSSTMESRQDFEQAKEQPAQDQSSDAEAIVPQSEESGIHEDDSAAKNAPTSSLPEPITSNVQSQSKDGANTKFSQDEVAGPVHSSDSTHSAILESSSSRSGDDKDMP